MLVPTITLNNGLEIPVIGNGPGGLGYNPHTGTAKRTLMKRAFNKFVTRPIEEDKYENAVAHAFKIGFTLLDDSASYGNDRMIAKAIKLSGVPREKLFITSRVSNGQQFKGNIEEEFFSTLKKLDTTYLDLYMFHWPVTDKYLDTWKQMEKLYKEGYVKSIGVANCNIHHLKSIFTIAEIKPMVNQFEIHPLFTQKPLIKFCQDNNIIVEAYSSIARFDDRLMRLPKLKKIAEDHNKSPVQVILRWDIQNGVIPIIRSLNKARQSENINIFDFELSSEEMQIIDSFNINARIRYDPDNCDFTIL